MRQLAREGKQISNIVYDDFPEIDYWDVYIEVYAGGEQSAHGIKRMITTRIKKLTESKSSKYRAQVSEELKELVCHLYENYKDSRNKLAKIRKAIAV